MKLHVIVTAALFAAAAPAVHALQQNRGTHALSRIDARAAEVVEQMRRAYAELHSFSVGISADYGGASRTYIAIKRPNKVRVDAYGPAGEISVTCDGRRMYAHRITDASRYVSVAAPSDGNAVFQAVVLSHSPAFFTAAVLTSYQQPAFQMLALEPAGVVEGVRVQNVRGRFRSTDVPDALVDIEMKIGESDHLLRQATLHIRQNGATLTATETDANGSIKLNPDLPESLFTFTPPPGAKRVESLNLDEQYYDPGVRPGGTPAPLHTADIKGHTVDLNQYQGRVVLLDYWATWCAPCLGELPNIKDAYDKFHRQGLDIISISLDDQSTRARLPAFVKQHGMTWPQVCDGKGFDSPLATPYKTSAIPFTLLIGRDGKIAAVNPRGPELEKAIRAALARK